MNTNNLIIILVIGLACISCGQPVAKNSRIVRPDADSLRMKAMSGPDSSLDPRKLAPLELLDALSLPASDNDKRIYSIRILDSFPARYVSRKDVKELLSWMSMSSPGFSNSSSTQPKTQATVGGYAVAMIESYRSGTRLSFDSLPSPIATDNAINDLYDWWYRENKLRQYGKKAKALLKDSVMVKTFWSDVQTSIRSGDAEQVANLIDFPFNCVPCEPDSIDRKTVIYFVRVSTKSFRRVYSKEFFQEPLRHAILDNEYSDLTFSFDDHQQAFGYSLPYTIVKPSKTSEGRQGFLIIEKVHGRYLITGIDQL